MFSGGGHLVPVIDTVSNGERLVARVGHLNPTLDIYLVQMTDTLL